MYLGYLRDSCNNRNGCLATAGHHVDVVVIQIRVQVHDRHTVRTDGRWSEIDAANIGLVLSQQGIIFHMGASGGGIENDFDVLELRHRNESINAFMRGGHSHAFRTSKAVGCRVDTDHYRDFHVFTVTQQLDHQIGPDVSAADNGGLDLSCIVIDGHGVTSQSIWQLTLPREPIRAWMLSPACTLTMGPSAPERMISPAFRPSPRSAMVQASQ